MENAVGEVGGEMVWRGGLFFLFWNGEGGGTVAGVAGSEIVGLLEGVGWGLGMGWVLGLILLVEGAILDGPVGWYLLFHGGLDCLNSGCQAVLSPLWIWFRVIVLHYAEECAHAAGLNLDSSFHVRHLHVCGGVDFFHALENLDAALEVEDTGLANARIVRHGTGKMCYRRRGDDRDAGLRQKASEVQPVQALDDLRDSDSSIVHLDTCGICQLMPGFVVAFGGSEGPGSMQSADCRMVQHPKHGTVKK